jgi:hypothetical protein
MKMTMTTSQIADGLLDDQYANWSYKGAHAMAEHLEQLEADLGQDMEFDPVAIRCDFGEYEGLVEWAEQYFGSPEKAKDALSLDEDDELDDAEDEIRDFIAEHGALIEFNGGIIVSNF